ncbi:wax ester/triacylglycerol synthase family O-acyltransferase [Massilia sp. DWR3-1-1]|uniref:wax ester/triacylglycerol synthase family O-acyltransferase n=1 Tax=Massilia sp. DWR3-1-1 TaxID=2804559 RepID=UPI003CF3E486
MPALPPEPLDAVDAAWLRMDRPTNLMMICGMMEFDGAIDLAAFKHLIASRMLCFHRFRQRVVRAGGLGAGPCWELDAHFDLDWHVRRLALPAGADALRELTSDLISTALDPSKPMWQFHLLEGDACHALVMRIHHCYGDGFAMLHLVEAITDRTGQQGRRGGIDLAAASPARAAWERVAGPLGEGVGDAWRAALAVTGAGAAILKRPGTALDYARSGASLIYQAGVLAAMAPDGATRLKGEMGVMKRVAWAAPLKLADVKAVAAVLDCSVNDVMVAAVAGALRAYLRDQGDAVSERPVRALLPVNLRAPGPVTELGNHFGLVFVCLPIGTDDPVERVYAVQRQMAQLKQSQQAQVALGILAGMGVAPEFLKERLVAALAANASLVLTNVRGPQEPRYLAGRRITRQIFWVPQSGGIGLGVSLLSYAGELSCGVVADARCVPDPGAIASRFAAQFEQLLLCTLMMPWPAREGVRCRSPA